LTLAWSSFTVPLEHFHYDTFFVKGSVRLGEEVVTFALGPDGEVGRLTFLDQQFRRRRGETGK
jgi:hypothetical protein